MKSLIKYLTTIILTTIIAILYISPTYARPLNSIAEPTSGKEFPILTDVFTWIETDMGLDPNSIQIKYLYGEQVPIEDRVNGGWVNESEPNTVYINATGIHNSFANNPNDEYLAYILFVSHELQHIKQIRTGAMNWNNYTQGINTNSEPYYSMNTENDAEKVSQYYVGRIVRIINGLEKMPEIK